MAFRITRRAVSDDKYDAFPLALNSPAMDRVRGFMAGERSPQEVRS